MIEEDLLRDRAPLPGAVDEWRSASLRLRQRRLRSLARAERHRSVVEARLFEDPALAAAWADFPVTEQREVLWAYGAVWPRSRSMRGILSAVAEGSDYRRAAVDEDAAPS